MAAPSLPDLKAFLTGLVGLIVCVVLVDFFLGSPLLRKLWGSLETTMDGAPAAALLTPVQTVSNAINTVGVQNVLHTPRGLG